MIELTYVANLNQYLLDEDDVKNSSMDEFNKILNELSKKTANVLILKQLNYIKNVKNLFDVIDSIITGNINISLNLYSELINVDIEYLQSVFNNSVKYRELCNTLYYKLYSKKDEDRILSSLLDKGFEFNWENYSAKVSGSIFIKSRIVKLLNLIDTIINKSNNHDINYKFASYDINISDNKIKIGCKTITMEEFDYLKCKFNV